MDDIGHYMAACSRLKVENEELRSSLRIAHCAALQGGYTAEEQADVTRVRTALGMGEPS